MSGLPFPNAYELSIHFAKHAKKFGITTESEYEKMADEFMFGPMNSDMRECLRLLKTRRCRMDFRSTYLGVACIKPECVLSFYPPDTDKIVARGGVYGFFRHECGRKK